MTIDEDGKHVCIRCEKKYVYRKDFRRHIMYACGVKPQFVCNVCLREFKHKCSLKMHILRKHLEYN